ncbi:hypothetical protein CA603_15785 [Paraburkholderia hospita]|nr:hypothetical protein CA603_15785 [Paraburkholderia hospita]
MNAPRSSKADHDWRRDFVGQHPIFCQSPSAALWTPPVESLYRQIKRLLLFRRSGVLMAETGAGKTCSLELIAKKLGVEFSGIVVIRFITPNKQCPSIRAFFKTFLWALDHPETSGETPNLRQRVTHKLQDMGLNAAWKLVWFWVDEAQALGLGDYCFLRDIQNDLRKVGVDLVVVFSGEAPDFDTELEQLRGEKGGGAVIDRFAR